MASNHCPVCGKKVGGLTGEALPYPRLIEEATSLGVNQDYICLTDMAKQKDGRIEIIIQNWMRNRMTIEFLGHHFKILYIRV